MMDIIIRAIKYISFLLDMEYAAINWQTLIWLLYPNLVIILIINQQCKNWRSDYIYIPKMTHSVKH